MKIAVLDIDDVSFNLRDGMLAALNKHSGMNLVHDDWTDYNLHGRYGITLQDFFDILIKEKVVENSDPEPWLRTFTHTLVHNGYQVDFLSARGWHPNAMEITKMKLTLYGIPHHNVNLVPIECKKHEFVKENYGSIELIVEDSPTHFHEIFVEHKLSNNGVLIERPWNKNYRQQNSHISFHFWKSIEQFVKLQRTMERPAIQYMGTIN